MSFPDYSVCVSKTQYNQAEHVSTSLFISAPHEIEVPKLGPERETFTPSGQKSNSKGDDWGV